MQLIESQTDAGFDAQNPILLDIYSAYPTARQTSRSKTQGQNRFGRNGSFGEAFRTTLENGNRKLCNQTQV